MTNPEIRFPDQTQDWLLDPKDPGASYLALHHLTSHLDGDLDSAREIAHTVGPISEILDQMHPGGYWENDDSGYLPKYRGSVWSIILLSQLGANVHFDPRISEACSHYLDNAMSANGQISISGPPSGTVDCLQGNILAAMVDMDYSDSRLMDGYEWMARSLTGDGVAPMKDKKAPLRFYSGKIGPEFRCGANNKMSCAWGAAKVMLAFSKLPEKDQTPLIKKAIEQGIKFLFGCDPATADYPNGWNAKPSGNWWKFGFPVFYVSDLLQICQSLVLLGFGKDPRLANALSLIYNKRTKDGKWLLEYDYKGKSWVDFGEKKKPNKWVTIRAYQALLQL